MTAPLDLSLPPRHVPPERLFRLLLGRPRPTLPLTFRFPFAPTLALSVRGLTALEDAEVVDVDPDLPSEIRRSEITRRLIAASLLVGGRLAFASAEDVGQLTDYEANALGNAVGEGLHVVSPMRRFANIDAWHDRLVEGARHPANRGITRMIGDAVDTVVLPRRLLDIGAPDRYFGIPFADLTDGQCMAYEAAKSLFDKASG